MNPFALTCSCGQALRGERQRRHQLLTCSVCGRSHFVLPVSPYDLPAPAKPSSKPSWRRWRTPILAAVASVVAILIGFTLLWSYLIRPPLVPTPEEDAKELFAARDAGRRALARGKFHVAWKRIDDLLTRRDRHPALFTAEQNRELNQLHRQADLLARLLTRPLEDIVRQGLLVRDPDEWEAQFAEYRGRTVLFDDAVRPDAEMRPMLANHVIAVGQETVRLALEDLAVLHDLPLDETPRMIFGGRLASCRREEGGKWVIHFEPDSGVLLTDPDLWQASTSSDLDEDVRRTLTRQHQWLEDGRIVPPARRGS